jgi:hypothetical protein
MSQYHPSMSSYEISVERMQLACKVIKDLLLEHNHVKKYQRIVVLLNFMLYIFPAMMIFSIFGRIFTTIETSQQINEYHSILRSLLFIIYLLIALPASLQIKSMDETLNVYVQDLSDWKFTYTGAFIVVRRAT